MSDFTHAFWSHYVTIITLVGIFGCLLLLLVTAFKRVPVTADNTTGHVWDEDLREANNPMPRWWVGLFLITIVLGLSYLFLFPGLGTYKGSLGWTENAQYESEVATANKELGPVYAAFAAQPVEKLANDQNAMGIGERLFLNNCAQCHGSDARGGSGFPNLTDKDWLYGGSPAQIENTITHGHTGVMPPMAAAVGTAEDVKNVANYVLSLSNSPHDSTRAALGKEKFVICAACHGADGKGNQELGAPNLTTGIFRYGYGQDAIIRQITNGKTNQMPAQEGRLTPAQIHVLAAYVWGLSNGGKSATSQ
jgi:cytochrome c oxidase cbb3-type subunit 3